MFKIEMVAGWGDMDFNSHMRNTAYLDKSGDVRMMFFKENGFPMKEFVKNGIGPVVRKDEIEYFKEVGLLEKFHVTISLAGLSDDGSHFILQNDFWRKDGKLIAKVKSTGGWLNLSARKLSSPPNELLKTLHKLTKTEKYKTLSSSVKPVKE